MDRALAWTSLVKGDEQPDQPNSHTNLECCHACDGLNYCVLYAQQLTTWDLRC